MTTDNGEPATELTPTPGSTECTTTRKGSAAAPRSPRPTYVLGVAAPPETAPPAVKAAIAAANPIRTRPYIWGGGHARWWSPGYDCSGAVSFALHGAGLITTPMDSGEMMNWGVPGKGRWITIYANAGHAFAVIDGLRWDTVGDEKRHRAALAPGNGLDGRLRRAASGRLLEPRAQRRRSVSGPGSPA